LVLPFAPLGARYIPPEIEQVPVSRVIRNLEQIAKAEPQNAQVRVNLARAHAMAYVLKTETLPMDRRATARNGPAFGADRPWVPFAGETSLNASPSAVAVAREHLAAAIRLYEDALRLTPDDPIARLGYGWVSSRVETGAKRWDDLRGTITEEAIDYLIPLLDAQRDREEIARLRGYLADAAHTPRPLLRSLCHERIAARASVGRVESSRAIRRRRQRT